MKKRIRYFHPASPFKFVFAAVLTAVSLYLLYTGAYYGLILLAASIKLALREGVEIDLETKKYRKLYAVFAMYVGIWKPLPDPIEYVSVFKTIKKSKARVIAAQADLGFEVYKLNLFYNTNKHIESYVTEDRTDAFEVANEMAIALNTEVYDATNE